jgi:hypothetical protein
MELVGKIKYIESKKFEVGRPVNISLNVNIKEIYRKNSKLIANFCFDVQYQPNIGYIKVEGSAAIVKAAQTDLDFFDQNKKLPDNLGDFLINNICQNCLVQAVIIANLIQLPPPIHFPKISRMKKKEYNQHVSYIA